MALESHVATKSELLLNFSDILWVEVEVWLTQLWWHKAERFRWRFTKATSSACEKFDGSCWRSEKKVRVLPWARRTRVGRRNLLTTASSGSANGLQVISDRLADNFSILPGHHGTGDEGDGDDGGGGDNDGGIGDEDEGDEDEGDGGCVMMSKSFAMFECGNEGRAQPLSVRCGGGRARNPSAFLPLSISVCPPPPWRPRTHREDKLWYCVVHH